MTRRAAFPRPALALAAAFVLAVSARAHGPGFNPGPPPPPPPPPFFGPVGGSSYVPLGGGPGVTPNAPETSGGATTPGGVPRATTGGGGAPAPVRPATALSRGVTGARGKTFEGPWLSRIVVPWKGVFAPVAGEQGYEPALQDASAGLRLKPEEGGWARDEAPSIVLTCDLSDPAQRRLLKVLEDDDRFVVASHAFNCFRVETHGLEGKRRELSLGVYFADGMPVGTLDGQKLLKVLGLMDTAWRAHCGKDLSKHVAELRSNLVHLAYLEHQIDEQEGRILCGDCGAVHDEAIKAAADLEARAADYRRAIDSFRSRP